MNQKDIEELKKEYEANTTKYEALIGVVEYCLALELKRKSIKIHSLPNRIKSFSSFLDKIQRKQAVKPFSEIQDLVGLRVVCLYLSDLELVRNIIKNAFNVFDEEDKNLQKGVECFGYFMHNIKAKLKHKINNPEYAEIQNIPFEIQIRTIAQDAWASISHHLLYKKENQLPQQIEKDFYALNGLFYVADNHFSLIRNETLRLAKGAK